MRLVGQFNYLFYKFPVQRFFCLVTVSVHYVTDLYLFMNFHTILLGGLSAEAILQYYQVIRINAFGPLT